MSIPWYEEVDLEMGVLDHSNPRAVEQQGLLGHDNAVLLAERIAKIRFYVSFILHALLMTCCVFITTFSPYAVGDPVKIKYKFHGQIIHLLETNPKHNLTKFLLCIIPTSILALCSWLTLFFRVKLSKLWFVASPVSKTSKLVFEGIGLAAGLVPIYLHDADETSFVASLFMTASLFFFQFGLNAKSDFGLYAGSRAITLFFAFTCLEGAWLIGSSILLVFSVCVSWFLPG